jgi:4'-phosphopantetheinyl transferase EntD
MPTEPPARSALLAQVAPPPVAVVEAFADVDAELFAPEVAYVAGAVASRRRAFTTARHCARRALAELGIAPVAIPPGERGSPVWPPGVVGSITHCDGYRAAAVARARDVLALGIDAEPNGPISERVLRRIALEPERAWVAAQSAAEPEVSWDRLLFSMKESVYKAWYPIARRWLGFEDALIDVDPARRTFTARLLVPGADHDRGRIDGFSGRWTVGRGLVVTAIAQPYD